MKQLCGTTKETADSGGVLHLPKGLLRGGRSAEALPQKKSVLVSNRQLRKLGEGERQMDGLSIRQCFHYLYEGPQRLRSSKLWQATAAAASTDQGEDQLSPTAMICRFSAPLPARRDRKSEQECTAAVQIRQQQQRNDTTR